MEFSYQWFIFSKPIFRTFWSVPSLALSPQPPCKALASRPLGPSTPRYGFRTLYGFHTEDCSAWKAGEKKNRILFPLSVWNPSPIEHLAIYCSFPPVVSCFFFFFPYRCLVLSRQTLTHHAQDKVWWLLRACAVTSSSWSGSSISGASSAHLHGEAMWGRGRQVFPGSGCLPQTQSPPLGMQDSRPQTVIPLVKKVPFKMGLWRRKRGLMSKL